MLATSLWGELLECDDDPELLTEVLFAVLRDEDDIDQNYLADLIVAAEEGAWESVDGEDLALLGRLSLVALNLVQRDTTHRQRQSAANGN